MIDLVKLTLTAGHGGNGRVAFRREKYVPKGGPNGGDGGRGGSIIVRANPKLTTLQHLAHVHDITAPSGKAGGKQLMTGESGEDIVVEVPVGTVIWLVAENEVSSFRRKKYGLNWRLPKADVRFKKYFLEKEGDHVPPRENDVAEPISLDSFNSLDEEVTVNDSLGEPAMQVAELLEPDSEIIMVQGGFGGRGNDRFKGSTNTTPLEAEYGTFGEQKIIYFELKLLADIGLVGLPNAGKSTLISRLTNAKPKIANYPFTTLEPQLGILTLGGGDDSRELVMADIPGLIEGAHEGKGLGFTFLRHVEHCQMLVYVLALPDEVVLDESLSAKDKALNLWQQYQTLEEELRSHSLAFLTKKSILIVNKIDIYNEAIIDVVKKEFKRHKQQPVFISAITGEGLDSFKSAVQENLA